jgi:starvation-inducible DNA-binding protein
MAKKNIIGLDPAKSKELSEKLNLLLANYQVYYINLRGFHWNITGDNFFTLHVKFEQLYTDVALKIDEVAERVRTLGNIPMHSFTDYLQNSEIKEVKNVSNGKDAVQYILNGLGTLIKTQRELLDMSDETGDEGTNSMMSDYIREQEKIVWMYTAFMK